MADLHKDTLTLIGNTPLVEVVNIEKELRAYGAELVSAVI